MDATEYVDDEFDVADLLGEDVGRGERGRSSMAELSIGSPRVPAKALNKGKGKEKENEGSVQGVGEASGT